MTAIKNKLVGVEYKQLYFVYRILEISSIIEIATFILHLDLRRTRFLRTQFYFTQIQVQILLIIAVFTLHLVL
jgi:hypothetical protein